MATQLGMDPKQIRDFYLLTAKPVLFVGNTDETPDPKLLADFAPMLGKAPAAG